MKPNKFLFAHRYPSFLDLGINTRLWANYELPRYQIDKEYYSEFIKNYGKRDIYSLEEYVDYILNKSSCTVQKLIDAGLSSADVLEIKMLMYTPDYSHISESFISILEKYQG